MPPTVCAVDGAPRSLPDLLADDYLLVVKLSPDCWTSILAAHEVAQFAFDHPEARVAVIDVVAERELARQLAARTGVRHASPQAILLERGRVLWSGGEADVTEEGLAAAWRYYRALAAAQL